MGEATRHRIFGMSFASVYPLYVEKAQKKGRTKQEVDEIIRWLTGYTQKGLEAQILAAWKGQMGGDPDAVAKELEAIPGYKAAFEASSGGPPTGDRIVKVLATFVRTIHAGDTPWDRLDAKTRDNTEPGRGFKVFSEVAKCTLCHLPPVLSDTLFHNVGIGFDKDKPDMGRGKYLADSAAKAGQPAPAPPATP